MNNIDDNTLTLKITTRIVIGVTLCILGAIGGCTHIRTTAMEQGYEEAALPGQTGTSWVKRSAESATTRP